MQNELTQPALQFIRDLRNVAEKLQQRAIKLERIKGSNIFVILNHRNVAKQLLILADSLLTQSVGNGPIEDEIFNKSKSDEFWDSIYSKE
jgi:hypothetical protein